MLLGGYFTTFQGEVKGITDLFKGIKYNQQIRLIKLIQRMGIIKSYKGMGLIESSQDIQF